MIRLVRLIRLIKLIRLDLQWRYRLHSYTWVGWDGMGWMVVGSRRAPSVPIRPFPYFCASKINDK